MQSAAYCLATLTVIIPGIPEAVFRFREEARASEENPEALLESFIKENGKKLCRIPIKQQSEEI